MNTPEIKNNIKVLLNKLEGHGEMGLRLIHDFRRYENRIISDLVKGGVSKQSAYEAVYTMLDVASFEVAAGTDPEMNSYDDFLSDSRAQVGEYDRADDGFGDRVPEEEVALDAILSKDKKEWLYKTCLRAAGGHLWRRGGASQHDIEDIASAMYARLLSKRIGDFKFGVPQCDAEWRAFLRKDAELSTMNYYKKSWRHPTVSLDERIEADGHEDDAEELTRMDALDYEAECFFQPNCKDGFLNTPESKFEIQFIPAVCAKIGSRSSARAQSMLRDLLLDDATVKEVSSKYGIKANAIYAAKKRFMDALRDDGEDGLAQAEACAA